MAKRRLPKGRARRLKSVDKIIKALESAPEYKLSFEELKEKTGLTSKTLSNTLKRMVENESIEREVTYDTPPKSYYSFPPLLSEDDLRKAREEYDKGYEPAIHYHDLEKYHWYEAQLMRLNVTFLSEVFSYIKNEKSRGDALQNLQKEVNEIFYGMGGASSYDVEKLYFQALKKAISVLRKEYTKLYEEDTKRFPWERCDRCKFGKVHLEKEQEEKVRCTRLWNVKGCRNLWYRKNHYCDHFEPR